MVDNEKVPELINNEDVYILHNINLHISKAEEVAKQDLDNLLQYTNFEFSPYLLQRSTLI